MPILYVNPAGGRRKARRFSVKGSARVGAVSKRRRKRKMPTALAAYWAKKRKGRKAKPVKARRKKRKPVAKKRRRSRKGSASMARRKRKKSGSVKKRRRARRSFRLRHKRRGRKRGRKSRRRAALLGVRRKRKGRKAARKRKYRKNPARKARRKRKGGARKRRRSRKARYGGKRRKARKSYRRRRRAARKGWGKRRRRRARYGVAKNRTMYGPVRRKRKSSRRKTVMGMPTLRMNPSRRRRKRRYGRRYRRNPFGGGMVSFLLATAKKAVPILASLIGVRMLTKLVAPKIPVNLGIAQGPVMAAAALVGAKYATKHVKFLGKYEDGIMIGAGINLVEQLISAFAPASVKGMLGMGLSDYVAVSDYLQVGPGSPIDDNITLSDYVQVGIDEELGLDQDLGLDQELGMGSNDFGQGGLGGGGGRMLAPVASQKFLAPVPNRSFVESIPDAGAGYDDPAILYTGSFGGGFGG